MAEFPLISLNKSKAFRVAKRPQAMFPVSGYEKSPDNPWREILFPADRHIIYTVRELETLPQLPVITLLGFDFMCLSCNHQIFTILDGLFGC